MRHTRPIAPDDLDVRTAHARKNCSTRARLNDVDITGQQCIVRSRAVFYSNNLNLESMPRSKCAVTNHEHEAGIALRLDHHVFPRLQVRGRCGSPQYSHWDGRAISNT